MVEEDKESKPEGLENPEGEEQSGFTSSAEAKMVMYVIPVAIVLIIAAYLLSRCNG